MNRVRMGPLYSDPSPRASRITSGSMAGRYTATVVTWDLAADTSHRRYHMYKYGRYPMPNDDEEANRETLCHLMFKEMLEGKLFLAPIGDSPQKIIDLGTGFGEWAIESTFSSSRLGGP